MASFTKRLAETPSAIFGAGSSDEEIKLAESMLGLQFACDFRAYLSEFSLMAIDGKELTGLTKSERLNVVSVTKKNRIANKAVPADFYVVEEAGIDGIVIWQNSSGNVFMTAPGIKPKLLASSLGDYIFS